MAINNFNYYNPTRILFGENQIETISKYISKDKKILITYGGGSVKRFGTLDRVKKALEGYNYDEFGSIEANPTFETCMKAVKKVKGEGFNFILAVGGGSVIDGTKFIAAASMYDKDPFDFFWTKNQTPVTITKAIPFATVLTLPATGSEMNSGAVISFVEKKAKLSFGSAVTFPQFSVLEPKLTYTLPKRQLANGVVDTFVHVMEQYMTYDINASIQDYYAEGILKTLIENGQAIVDENNHDYATRANFMWAATNGLNGYIAVGVPEDWSTHQLGHEITAKYGIDHARTLAIVLPAMLKVRRKEKETKLLRYAKNVWNIQGENKEDTIDKAIAKTEEFFQSLGVPTSFAAYEIGQDAPELLTKALEEHGRYNLGENGEITLEVSKKVYTKALK